VPLVVFDQCFRDGEPEHWSKTTSGTRAIDGCHAYVFVSMSSAEREPSAHAYEDVSMAPETLTTLRFARLSKPESVGP
jgi:hypothetical protein